MTTPTFTATGTKSTTAAKLNKDVFDVNVSSHSLIKQAYIAYQANGRENLAKTLKRGEVRGGGRKPWKQKGTGRARFGSIRVPIWRGGGITFGPLGKENYSKRMPAKARRQAIRQALSINKGNVVVVDTPKFDGKTAKAAKFFASVGAKRKTLFVVATKDESTVLAIRNLSDVTVVNAQYLNVYDIMNADTIVIVKDAMPVIDAWLAAPMNKEAKK